MDTFIYFFFGLNSSWASADVNGYQAVSDYSPVQKTVARCIWHTKLPCPLAGMLAGLAWPVCLAAWLAFRLAGWCDPICSESWLPDWLAGLGCSAWLGWLTEFAGCAGLSWSVQLAGLSFAVTLLLGEPGLG